MFETVKEILLAAYISVAGFLGFIPTTIDTQIETVFSEESDSKDASQHNGTESLEDTPIIASESWPSYVGRSNLDSLQSDNYSWSGQAAGSSNSVDRLTSRWKVFDYEKVGDAIFYKGDPVPEAHASSFGVLTSSYFDARDDHNVYINGEVFKLTDIVPGDSDALSKLVISEDGGLLDNNSYYDVMAAMKIYIIALLQDTIHEIQSDSKNYFANNGEYTGFCKNESLRSKINDKLQYIKDYSMDNLYCRDFQDSFYIAVDLPSRQTYCADNSGFRGQVQFDHESQGNVFMCPQWEVSFEKEEQTSLVFDTMRTLWTNFIKYGQQYGTYTDSCGDGSRVLTDIEQSMLEVKTYGGHDMFCISDDTSFLIEVSLPDPYSSWFVCGDSTGFLGSGIGSSRDEKYCSQKNVNYYLQLVEEGVNFCNHEGCKLYTPTR